MRMWCFVASVFFFKQKTAYEMVMSDWSSDVCSSDLGERQGGTRRRANHQRGVGVAGRGHRAARVGLGLRELGERDAAGEGRRVHGGRETVGRARASDRHEHAPRRSICQEKLEPAHLVAAAARRGAVFALEPQRVQSEGREESGGRFQRRGPTPETAGRERLAYLSGQSLRIGHSQPLSPRAAMRVATDYIRHAARAARKCAGDPLGGAPEPPDPEFYKTLAKALEEIAAGLEQLGKEE